MRPEDQKKLGDAGTAGRYAQRARRAAEDVADDEDRQQVLSDLATLPQVGGPQRDPEAEMEPECRTRRTGTELDAYLDQILIGGRERREIVIVEYDPQWPARFAAERERVQRALGSSALRILHFGSTAVPGLAAKPIIDVLVTVADPEDDDAIVAALESAGYQLRVREPGHRMFRTPARDVHLHLWSESDPEVTRLLRFRDRLRGSADDRRAYEQLKRDLAGREWPDMNHYAEAKSDLIDAILERA